MLLQSADITARSAVHDATSERVRAYSWFALAVLTLASVFNFADRQIVSILAQSIKGDLGLTDAQLGFLLGTAFAVFYAVVGIAMGRIADGMTPATAGVALGLTYAAGAGVGVVSGGWLTDRWKMRDARAPIWTALIGLIVAVPVLLAMLATRQPAVYVAAYGVFGLFASAWSAAYAALVQDLVLPRMRGGAASAFALVCVIVGAGGGPYWVGKLSVLTGSLASGLLSTLALVPFVVVVLLLTARRLRHENENGRRARAAAYGETLNLKSSGELP